MALIWHPPLHPTRLASLFLCSSHATGTGIQLWGNLLGKLGKGGNPLCMWGVHACRPSAQPAAAANGGSGAQNKKGPPWPCMAKPGGERETGVEKQHGSTKQDPECATKPDRTTKTGVENNSAVQNKPRRAKQARGQPPAPPRPCITLRRAGGAAAPRAGPALQRPPSAVLRRGAGAAGECAAGPWERTRVWKQRGHTNSAAAPAKRLAHRGVGCRRGPQNAPGNKGGAGAGIARRGRCDTCAWPPSLGCPVSARASFCPLDLELLRLHSTPRRFPGCCR